MTETNVPPRQQEADQSAEHARTRRTIVFLGIALVLMALMLCGLAYFYVTLVGPSRSAETYESTNGPEGYSIEFLQEYYGYGKAAGEQFERPHDVNITPNGDIVVADSQNGRVVIMSRAGELVAQVGADQSWGPGNIDAPAGVAAGPDGRIYVADSGVNGPHGKLAVLSADLSRVEAEVMYPPKDPPITPRVYGDEVYVTSVLGVKVYDLDGKLLREWGGTLGKAPEEFSFPNGILKRADGTVVVSESNNRRLKYYDARGTLTSVVGTPPVDIKDKSDSLFELPMGITEDETGLLYMADAWGYKIRILDADGKELATVGDVGSSDGQFNAPGGIAYVGDREFLIADEMNHRIVRARINVPGQDSSVVDRVAGGNSALLRTCAWVVPLLILVLIALYVISRLRRRAAGHGQADASNETS